MPLPLVVATDRADLVSAVLEPTLRYATSYDRAAGYFRASSLVAAGTGISSLVRNGGTMRLVMGVPLTADDEKAWEIHGSDVLRSLADVRGSNARAVAALGALLHGGRLEVRMLTCDSGAFHAKSGLISDGADTVAFNGSANETYQGLALNIEQVTVHRGWVDGENEHCLLLRRSFDRWWSTALPLRTVVPSVEQDLISRAEPPLPETEDLLVQQLVDSLTRAGDPEGITEVRREPGFEQHRLEERIPLSWLVWQARRQLRRAPG